jgi:hypothetical protein
MDRVQLRLLMCRWTCRHGRLEVQSLAAVLFFSRTTQKSNEPRACLTSASHRQALARGRGAGRVCLPCRLAGARRPQRAACGICASLLAGGAILTISSRQHLATPDMHANEVLAAGTIMHKIVPLRGFLTEERIPQEHGTPLYIDSASTVFVAQSRGAVKKSAWIRRRSQVLTEAFDMGECDPIKIEEYKTSQIRRPST